jgi:secreted PhoX family phosphatase
MGAFTHEAAAVDPVHGHIYLTEDLPDSNLYRFVPDHYPESGRPQLESGRLQAAIVNGDNPFSSRSISWATVTYPVPQLSIKPDGSAQLPTRKQVTNAEKFNGGEGCWFHNGIVYFSTKGDNRVWAVDTNRNLIDVIYDKKSQNAFNTGIDDVDNVTVSAGGEILIAEDGAEMRLVVIGQNSKPFELINIQGHRGSEITGPAFNPDGNRLYFSSQRGLAGNS